MWDGRLPYVPADSPEKVAGPDGILRSWILLRRFSPQFAPLGGTRTGTGFR
jgi:hypothetical protein